jgi:hypothetical protein
MTARRRRRILVLAGVLLTTGLLLW